VSVAYRLPLPPGVLGPNGRGHWAARHRARRDYEETAIVLSAHAIVTRRRISGLCGGAGGEVGASIMKKMLGKESHRHRGKNFWFCCIGHDGWNRTVRIIRKRIERHREKREWKQEEGI